MGKEADLVSFFGVRALEPRKVYNVQDITSEDLAGFIASIRGVAGVYQTLLVIPSGDMRESYFHSLLVEDKFSH